MKAEHRKELETNTLADRMGRLLEGAKQKPQGSTVTWIVIGVLVFVAALLVMRWYNYGKTENFEGWYALYVNDYKGIQDTYLDKPQGRSVRFDLAWEQLWIKGIKQLGVDPRGAKEVLLKSKVQYEELGKECEGDPVLAPEAIYHLAVIEETLAIEDRTHLQNAMDLYKEASSDKFSQSAFGQLAKSRLETLKSDDGRKEVTEIYQELERIIPLNRLDRKN